MAAEGRSADRGRLPGAYSVMAYHGIYEVVGRKGLFSPGIAASTLYAFQPFLAPLKLTASVGTLWMSAT